MPEDDFFSSQEKKKSLHVYMYMYMYMSCIHVNACCSLIEQYCGYNQLHSKQVSAQKVFIIVHYMYIATSLYSIKYWFLPSYHSLCCLNVAMEEQPVLVVYTKVYSAWFYASNCSLAESEPGTDNRCTAKLICHFNNNTCHLDCSLSRAHVVQKPALYALP